MSKLFRRRKNNNDDLESNAGRRASRASRGGRAASIVDDSLGEFPALDHYISNYREDRRRPADDRDGKVKKKHWWQFGSGVDAQEEPPAKKGTPDAWLETDLTAGLASDEVEGRRQVTGWNELVSEKNNMFAQFLSYFTGPILYGKSSCRPSRGSHADHRIVVMEVAALLAVGLGDWVDFGVIVGILMLNAFVGFYQEKQAADVVASLKGDIAMRCTVIRDSNEQEILARELVPGDIVSGYFLKPSDSSGSFLKPPDLSCSFLQPWLINALAHCSRRRYRRCRCSPYLRLHTPRRF